MVIIAAAVCMSLPFIVCFPLPISLARDLPPFVRLLPNQNARAGCFVSRCAKSCTGKTTLSG